MCDSKLPGMGQASRPSGTCNNLVLSYILRSRVASRKKYVQVVTPHIQHLQINPHLASVCRKQSLFCRFLEVKCVCDDSNSFVVSIIFSTKGGVRFSRQNGLSSCWHPVRPCPCRFIIQRRNNICCQKPAVGHIQMYYKVMQYANEEDTWIGNPLWILARPRLLPATPYRYKTGETQKTPLQVWLSNMFLGVTHFRVEPSVGEK